jgi:hypothetical protein
VIKIYFERKGGDFMTETKGDSVKKPQGLFVRPEIGVGFAHGANFPIGSDIDNDELLKQYELDSGKGNVHQVTKYNDDHNPNPNFPFFGQFFVNIAMPDISGYCV